MPRLALIVLTLLLAVAGCSSDPRSDSAPAPQPASDTAAVVAGSTARDLVADGAVLVDVRDPGEYAAGHVEGARSVPWESGDFDAGVEPLDRDATYVLYCATGRRAALAAERMAELGFADVHNAGGLEDVADVVGPVVPGR